MATVELANLVGFLFALIWLMILPIVLPVALARRKLKSFFYSPVRIANNVVLVTGASSGIGRVRLRFSERLLTVEKSR